MSLVIHFNARLDKALDGRYSDVYNRVVEMVAGIKHDDLLIDDEITVLGSKELVDGPKLQSMESTDTTTPSVRCWYCTLDITEEKPIRITTINKERIGFFCSFPCAFAYNASTLPNPLQNEVFLRNDYYTRTGEYKTILPAPRRESLILYGGDMTVEEYRKKISELVI